VEAYTLMEICLAMAVVAVMLGVAVPLTHGIISEERLRLLANDLADVASAARKLSVREGRIYVVKVSNGRIGLGPWEGEGKEFKETLVLKLPKEAKVAFRNAEGEKWKNELEWIFQPGGLADPMQIRLQEGNSWCVREFNPLTSVSREESSHFQ
jgi:Tfp pilus assembly protein FimT